MVVLPLRKAHNSKSLERNDMKFLHLQPVSTIFVAISVAAKPANNPVDGHVRSLRGKEDAPDAPFIGPLSSPHEVTRQSSHELSSSLMGPSDHRVLGIKTGADYDVEVNGDLFLYSAGYGLSSSRDQLMYPNANVKLHATGDVYVFGTPADGSVLEVHSDKHVVVRGTGSGSTLKVHTGWRRYVYVYGTGDRSTVQLYTDGNVDVYGTGR